MRKRNRPGIVRVCGTLLALGIWMTGCGGPGPNLDLLTVDVGRLQAEAKTLAADSTSLGILNLSVQKKAAADRSLNEKDPASARLALEEAEATARVALAAALAHRQAQEADACRRTAAEHRREWEDAIRMLEQTEKVAGRQTKGIRRTPPEETVPDPLPELRIPPDKKTPLLEEIRADERAWKLRASEFQIAVADEDGRILTALARAHAPKQDQRTVDHHHRIAAWSVREMAERVREESARLRCRRDLDRALEFTTRRDQALWAMLDLERSMKESVRSQLEEERGRLADREQALYESLRQFEGQFATIRREARGTVMSLSDILFDFGKAELRREAELNLAKVALILEQYPEMSILIEGHTDNIGSEEYNLELSMRRAGSVHDFLQSQRIDAARMETRGYGMSQPVASNTTPEDRQKNRRVDLVIREE